LIGRDDVHVAYQVIGDGPRDLLFVPGFVSDGIRLGGGNEDHEAQHSDPNLKKLLTSFIPAPIHFPIRTDGAHQQLTNLFAI
jgi:hypothetical protein